MNISIFKRLLIVVCCCYGFGAFGQTGAVTGKVVTSDQLPAARVTLRLLNTAHATQSSDDGTYKLQHIKAGNYTIRATAVGMASTERLVKISANETTVVDFTLAESKSQLTEVTIQSGRTTYKKDKVSRSLRVETPLLELPQNIGIVSAEILKDQQSFGLLENVSRNVSGVTSLNNWGPWNAQVIIRGSRAIAGGFRNGMSFGLPGAYGGVMAEDASIIENVEYVKGPAGFLLGNAEAGGVYNVNTKKPTGADRNEVNLTIGSFKTFRVGGDFDNKIDKNGKFLFRISGALTKANRFTDFDYENRYAIDPSITYAPDSNTTITAEYVAQGVKSLSTGYYIMNAKGFTDAPINLTFSDPAQGPQRAHEQAGFLYATHKFNPNWKATAQLAAGNFVLQDNGVVPNYGVTHDDLLAGNITRNYQVWHSYFNHRFAQLFINGHFNTGGIAHRLLAGIDAGAKEGFDLYKILKTGFPFNVYNPQYGGIVATQIPAFSADSVHRTIERINNGHIQYQYSSGYIQDELGFFENRVRLTLAGRYTETKKTDGLGAKFYNNHKFTPRFGLSASITRDFSAYAVYDQSFMEQLGKDYSGNDFKPLYGENIEFGLKKDFFDQQLSATLSVYKITRNNYLTPDLAHTGFSVQTGQNQSKGLELDINGKLTQNLAANLNYAYTDSKITKDNNADNVGKKTNYTAAHVTNGWFKYFFTDGVLEGFRLNAGFAWQHDRWSSASGSMYPAAANKQFKIPDYFELNAGAGKTFKQFGVDVIVNNITNKKNFQAFINNNNYVVSYLAPLNYRVMLTYKF